MNINKIFLELKAFVLEQSAADDVEIRRETSIANDLGVYGDDATEFIMAYSKRFNVDVSRFMAADYFRAEGGISFSYFSEGIFGREGKRYKNLTVGDLEKGILARRLDQEVLENL